jgi:hypothetical protein
MKKTNKMGTTKRRYIGKGRRKQKGELSLVEAAGVMAAAALIALVVYMGRGYVMDRIHAMQFKSEAQYFVSGIQDATAGEIDFSSVTMLAYAKSSVRHRWASPEQNHRCTDRPLRGRGDGGACNRDGYQRRDRRDVSDPARCVRYPPIRFPRPIRK